MVVTHSLGFLLAFVKGDKKSPPKSLVKLMSLVLAAEGITLSQVGIYRAHTDM